MGRSAAVISINSVHTQGHSLAKQVIFPSFVLPTQVQKSTTIHGHCNLDVVTVEVNNFFFTVGRDSLYIEGPPAKTNWGAFSPGSIGQLALIRTALWYLQQPTIDLLILGLPIQMIHHHQTALDQGLLGEHWLPHFFKGMGNHLHSHSRVEVRQAIVMPRSVIALFAAALEHSVITEADTLVLDFNLDTLDILCASKMRPIKGQQAHIPGGTSGFITQLSRSILESRVNTNNHFIAQEPTQADGFIHITKTPLRLDQQACFRPDHLNIARQVIENYLDQAIALLPSMEKMQLAVLTGSGAHLLAPILPAYLPNLKKIITPLTPEKTLIHGFNRSL